MSRGIGYNGARFRQRTGHSLGFITLVAEKLPPEPRKVKPAPLKRGGGNVKVNDETALRILLDKLRGETYADLEAKHNVKAAVIQQWVAGTNRPHLIERAEAIVAAVKSKQQEICQ